MTELVANLVELMVSVQGEGPWVGRRQIFLRFAGCNLACAYCDTPGGRIPWHQDCLAEQTPGSGRFVSWSNPLSVSQVGDFIRQNLLMVHSVSLTGGEPLLHAGFIDGLARFLQPRKPSFYLETNGTLPEELAPIIETIDFIAMDIKLPLATGQETWREHEQFLRLAAQKSGFAKLIVTPDTTAANVRQAAKLVGRQAPEFPLVLQPMTDNNGLPAVTARMLWLFQTTALQEHQDVRIIPQTHRYLRFH
ncbi:MAG: 7-carboxy-7-deazaguanine synthase QueE [Heliobacteriaceae bacterium]|nr:7-carboxy-7-deazaguanine synthase QueE [Heliobacteriaceae bacterium]MDD4586794.1 7-carboxy-7-deazaguanine synthase QueE [Heliobacteriaceae bacterium]